MGAAYSYNAARSGCYGGSSHACGVCGTSEIVVGGSRGRNDKGTTVTAVAFQPGGKGFASALGHGDGRVELSIARPPQEARLLLSSSQQLDGSQGSYQYRPQQVREVVSLHFAGDDSLVVVRSDGKCEVYDDLFSKCFAVGAEKRQNVPPTYVFQAQKMTPQGDAVTSVYACGEEIATGGGDGSVTFWRSVAGQEQLQQEKGDQEHHLRSCRAEVEEYDYIDYSKGAMPLRAVALDKETMIYWNNFMRRDPTSTAEIPCDRAASITANRLQLWDLHRMRAGFSSVSSSAPQFQHLKFFAKPLFFPPSIGIGAACAAWVATGGQEFVALYDVRISGGGRNTGDDRTNPVQFYDVPGVTIMNVAHSSTSSGRSVDQFSMALHAQSYTGRRYQFDLRKKVMVTGE
eukprot:g5224.t1